MYLSSFVGSPPWCETKCSGSVKPSHGMRSPPASPPPGYPNDTDATLVRLHANAAETMSMKNGESFSVSAPVRIDVSSVGTGVFVGDMHVDWPIMRSLD